MALLYERAGRLTAKNGGFRPHRAVGRGNEVVALMCKSLEHLLVGKSLEDDILSDLMTFSRTLTQVGLGRIVAMHRRSSTSYHIF
jgi:hypothetical protein